MALEDFFTLTEIKDGLANVARVKEFMSVMQKKDHFTVSRVRDEARQWSTVASILEATEDKDCLDHFIRLNGVWFLNAWLKSCCDAPEGSVEETINLILGALQKLHLDRKKYRKKMISSEILSTVKHVFCNIKNPLIQERARMLLDKWDSVCDEVVNHQDEEKHELCCDDELKDDTGKNESGVQSTHPVPDVFSSKAGDGEGSYDMESAENNSLHSNDNRCIMFSEEDVTKDAGVPDHSLLSKSSSGDAKMISADASVSNPCQENVSIAEESTGCPIGNTNSAVCKSPSAMERNVDIHSECSQRGATCIDTKENEVEMDTRDSGQREHSHNETLFVSSSSGLSSLPLGFQSSFKETAGVGTFDSKEAESGSAKICELRTNSDVVESGLPKYKEMLKVLKAVGKDLSGGTLDDVSSSFQGMEVLGACSNILVAGGSSLKPSRRAHHRLLRGSSKAIVGTGADTEKNQARPGISLDYGDDALEVAVQVAIEAKREVADRERHSSSPEGNSEEEITDSSSSESEKSNCDQPKSSKSPTKIDHSDDNSSPPENSSKMSDNIDNDSKHPGEQGSENRTSAHESHQNSGKKEYVFDLNEDICSEDNDYLPAPVYNHQNNLSAPKAVIATSKGSSGLPVTPLHFEGELGWRGSAATSAFRAASPRRVTDGQKISFGPRQNSNFLKIDLNVVEDENDDAADTILEKQISVSSGLPSGESSVEVTSAKAERLKLDLNRLGEENTFPNMSSHWKLQHQPRNGSPSPASSSNVKQPSMRDIDLNDNPSFFDSCGSNMNRCFIDTGGRGKFKPDDPVVTIMGSRMVVERKEMLSQNHVSFLANGSGMEPTVGGRTSMSYSQTPTCYGYNGLSMGPPISLPPAIYGSGSFPCMVDSRGTAVVPQILGPASPFNVPTTRPPFLVNIPGTHSGVVGSSRPDLDLNTMSLSLDGGAKESANFTQLFMQGHSGLREEQTSSASQPSSGSTAGLKRKEPDCGWGNYPIGYKQVTSWQ